MSYQPTICIAIVLAKFQSYGCSIYHTNYPAEYRAHRITIFNSKYAANSATFVSAICCTGEPANEVSYDSTIMPTVLYTEITTQQPTVVDSYRRSF